MLQRIKDRRLDDEGGFTLIELLVVIIILGILAAVVVFAVGGVGDKGQKSACKIDTRTLRTAQEAYAAQPTTATPAGGGGNYAATTDALRTAGFLSEASKYHEFTAVTAVPNASFKIKVIDTGCGTVNGTVGLCSVGTPPPAIAADDTCPGTTGPPNF